MEIAGESRPNSLRQVAGLGAAALGASVPILMLGRVAMAVAITIAVLALLITANRRQLLRDVARAMRSPLGVAVGVTFLLWFVSVIGSLDPTSSAGVWLRMAALLIVGTAFAAVMRHDTGIHETVLKTLIVAAMTGAALSVVSVLVWPELYLMLRGDQGLSDPSYYAAQRLKSYGAAIACAMPVVLWAGWRLGSGWRLAAIIYLPLAIVAMLAVDSRASVIAAALSAGVLACWFVARRGRIWIAILIACALAAVVAGTFLTNTRSNQIEPLTSVPTWLVDAHRQTIWAKGLDLAADAPIFGWGFDTISELPGADEIVPGSDQAYIPSHPHNWLIEVLVETGVVGFAAIVGTLVLLLWGAVRAARRDGAAGATMLALLAAFFVISSISFSFWAFWWQATFVLLASMVAGGITPGLLSIGFGPAVKQP